MRATVFPFIASHAVAETMKRSAIQRLEQPELLPIRSNTPDLVVRLSTNLDATTRPALTKKRPEASHRRALPTSTPRLRRTAFLQSVQLVVPSPFESRILRAANTALDEECRNKGSATHIEGSLR